jgi:hypothetical protein
MRESSFRKPAAAAAAIRASSSQASRAVPAERAIHVDGGLGDAGVACPRPVCVGRGEGHHGALFLHYQQRMRAVEPGADLAFGALPRFESGRAVRDALVVDAGNIRGVFQPGRARLHLYTLADFCLLSSVS